MTGNGLALSLKGQRHDHPRPLRLSGRPWHRPGRRGDPGHGLLLALLSPDQAIESIAFTGRALVDVSIFLLLSVGVAAYAKASGSDRLIAKAFSGRTATMIVAASLMGALSPFCSCGVIPLIAAPAGHGRAAAGGDGVLAGLADHGSSMFVLTAGTLGPTFALYKTFAAVVMGLLGGFGTAASDGKRLV